MADMVKAARKVDWDPHKMPEYTPAKSVLKRIKKDLRIILRDPLPGIVVQPGETDLTTINALVIGPSDTPYAGGSFIFRIRMPFDYPNSPPRVKLLTTGGGTVRFNPNLYKNGKVCLSIL